MRVIVGNNVDKETDNHVEPSDTPRSVFEKHHIEYGYGMNTLDGSPMKPGDMDKTFAELGVTDICYLLSIKKTDNA